MAAAYPSKIRFNLSGFNSPPPGAFILAAGSCAAGSCLLPFHTTLRAAGFCFLGCLFLAVLPVRASLVFEKTVIEDVVPPGESTYAFAFPFENTGDATVEIREIQTTCGCTTATLETMTYAPGESGVILGTFSVGNRQGQQSKKIRVFTRSLAQPEIQLALNLEIPQLVTMKPGLLLWRVGTEPDTKTLTISPNADLGAEIVSVECASPDFAVESLPKDAESDAFEVLVAPLTTESSGRGLIKVVVAVADAEPKTIYAHALIR